MALAYGERLAEAGIQIISGMARGIDGAAQRGALNGGGRTYGVLGCGVDICYPREHRGLYCDILKEGGLLSEQLPGEPPLAGYFPARNRIISGLSDLVLVMEAKERSGSLITADMALEEGKDVFALPGLATSPMSRGCHRLIAPWHNELYRNGRDPRCWLGRLESRTWESCQGCSLLEC